MRLRILLIEDEPLWQQGISALIATSCDYEIVGIVDNDMDAFYAFNTLHPDIILVDWQLKNSKDGITIANQFVQEGFAADQIIVISWSERSLIPENPFQYVPKSHIATDLLQTLGHFSVKL